MIIYLARHGIATPRFDATIDDAGRPLTPEGIKKTRRAARGMSCLGVELAEVWSSPLVRAMQTARIFAEVFDLESRLKAAEPLAPSGSIDELASALRDRADSGDILCVGHEPFLGRAASYLLTGGFAAALEFKKGAVAAFELDSAEPGSRARLRWLMTAKQLGMVS